MSAAVASLDPFGSAIALLRLAIKVPIDHSSRNDRYGSVAQAESPNMFNVKRMQCPMVSITLMPLDPDDPHGESPGNEFLSSGSN
jgi:hypothetical protein